MKPVVSIITAAYNAERTITDTVRSVLAQTVSDWELIIVDDGSTDCMASKLSALDDPRIQVIHQANAGRSNARNRGIENAKGEHLLFLDADDRFTENAIEEHLAFRSCNPAFGVSVGDGYFCSDDGQLLASFSSRRGAVESGDVLERLIVDAGVIGGSCSAMVDSEVVRNHRIRFDESLEIGEDWLFWIGVAARARFGFFPAATSMYRWHSLNTTLSVSDAHRQEQLWEGRKKVLESRVYDGLTRTTRYRFFYQSVIEILGGNPKLQNEALTCQRFLLLPPADKAKILRLAAAEYLVVGSEPEPARQWLRRARTICPKDAIALSLDALVSISPAIASLAIKVRRVLRIAHQAPKSEGPIGELPIRNSQFSRDACHGLLIQRAE